MTVIHLTPLLQDATERVAADAVLIARASFPFLADGAAVVAPQQLRWHFKAGETVPIVELAEPDGYAWLLQLQIGAWKQTRAVMWLGAELDWAELTDVDPATLTSEGTPSMPSGAQLITRDEVEDLLTELGPDGAPDAAVAARITSPTSLTRAALSATYLTLLTAAATFTWNADGTVATQTIGGATTTFAWNVDGTLNTETRNGVTRTYAYNTNGTLASVA